MAASPASSPGRSLESNRISRSLQPARPRGYIHVVHRLCVCCVGVRLRPQLAACACRAIRRPVHGERRQHQGAAARDEHLLRDDEPPPPASVLVFLLLHACGRCELHVKFFLNSTVPFSAFFDSASLFVLFLLGVVVEFLIDRFVWTAGLGLMIWLVMDSLIVFLSLASVPCAPGSELAFFSFLLLSAWQIH